MAPLQRLLHDDIIEYFSKNQKRGLIVSGVVGCGKTTLIRMALKDLKKNFQIFEFTGDDVQFRENVKRNTKFLYQTVISETQNSALVFVDEVQKSEEIFDALKYAFDHADISFVVSGSNPEYLSTVAKKRLQRRSHFLFLQPFALPEVIELPNQERGSTYSRIFKKMIFGEHASHQLEFSLSRPEQLGEVCQTFMVYGGFPLPFFFESPVDKFIEIRSIVERGFEPMSTNDANIVDAVRVDLARMHSKEFAYQGFFQRTGIRKREVVNEIIDDLKNHAYLVRKKPILPGFDGRSYLSVYSYVDPGIVSYLLGNPKLNEEALGRRIEGVIHARLEEICRNSHIKSELHYFKPFDVDVNHKVKFHAGEIDFILARGDELIPIEVKAASNIGDVSTEVIAKFTKLYKAPFGVVLYDGMPFFDKKERVVFWPYWLV